MTKTKPHIPFVKMQGAGNDFIVIDNRELQLSSEKIAALAPNICNRKFGVGSDGILALTSAVMDEVDYTMIYRNPDGSNAGMCGNGARCIALFAHSLGYDANHHFNVHGTVYEAEIKSSNTVCISFPIQTKVREQTVNGQQLYQLFTGTEHIVLPVNEEKLAKEDELRTEGSKWRHHENFQPQGTNVNFISGIDKSELKLQTFERGVEDLTLACGTGAIASALVWHYLQKGGCSSNTFHIQTSGGTLKVHFTLDPKSKIYSNIKLEGPAHFVFKGEFLR
jgi:diaminopimelate epimerase